MTNYSYNSDNCELLNFIPFDNELFQKINENLSKIVKNYGYNNLLQYFNFINFNISSELLAFLHEINDLIIPISVNYFHILEEEF